MPAFASPEDLAAMLRSLERRIKTVETTARSPFASIAYPARPQGAVTSSWFFQNSTPGFFTSCWAIEVDHIAHEALRVRVPWITGPTASVRLQHVGTGRVTDSLALPSSDQGTLSFNWLHEVPVGVTAGTDVFSIDLEPDSIGTVSLGYPVFEAILPNDDSSTDGAGMIE